MISFLIRAAIFLGSAAVGLLVASLILSGFSAPTSGFIVAVVIFAPRSRERVDAVSVTVPPAPAIEVIELIFPPLLSVMSGASS